MEYNSFIDFITSEGCSWFKGFDPDFGNWYQNNHTRKICFLKKYDWVPWPAAMLFCYDIGIDYPAEMQHLEAQFKQLNLTE